MNPLPYVYQTYQDHLRQLAADRKRKMDYFEGIANQYDQEYGSVDMSSVERQVGKEA